MAAIEIEARRAQDSTSINKNLYGALKTRVRDAGLLQSQGRYYGIKMAYTLAMFAAGLVALFLLDGWVRILVAPYLAFVCAQLGFLAHDFGHKQVFSSSRVNNWVGMLMANLLV